jgi:seryl-tRNA synthetase
VIDLKWIRENPELAAKGAKSKNVEIDFNALIALDEERRSLIQEVELLKAQRNEASEKIANLKKTNQPAEDIMVEMKSISQKIKDIDIKVGEKDEKIGNIMLYIPNMPISDVPVSKAAENNKIVRTWGDLRTFSFKAKTQVELGIEPADMKDQMLSMAWGSYITGSGFPVYRGKGARLERALINFMLDFHIAKHGYEEIWPPSLVNRQSMIGTGQLPKMEDDMYKLTEEDFFLIPTGEVPVTNLYGGKTLQEEELPIKHVAYTPCFRREAGSYGKDTKGLSRVHQFDKVEMVKFVKPEDSDQELESLVKDAEDILQALELPYRVLLLGSGDMSFAAAKCYDLEVWAPGSEKWFEVSSCSTFRDFQARRANIRFKRGSEKPEFVHTLNGSGLALARIFLCLLENFQTEEGKIEFDRFPKALKPYLKPLF